MFGNRLTETIVGGQAHLEVRIGGPQGGGGLAERNDATVLDGAVIDDAPAVPDPGRLARERARDLVRTVHLAGVDRHAESGLGRAFDGRAVQFGREAGLDTGHVDPDDPSLFIVDTGLEWPEDGNESLLPALDTVVVTAATSRYPAEIPLGRIVEVLPGDEDMLTMHVRVALANDITDLGFVSVLLAEGVDQVPLDEPVPSTSIPLTTTTSAGEGS